MRLRDVGEWLAGRLFPIVVDRGRDVFAVDGVGYRMRLVWFGRGIQLGYTTPRYPSDVRRIRAQEDRHLAQYELRRQASEPYVQVGDVIPAHRIIPVDVLEVRTARGEVWRRAVGDERFGFEEGTGEIYRDQVYDWVSMYEPPDGKPEIAGQANDDGVLAYAPLTVTKVTGRV